MIRSAHKKLFRRSFLFGIAGTAALVALFNSCNDTGTSPYAPSISYKRPGVAGLKDQAIVPDTLIASGSGVINGYSITPPLPAGLTFDTKTGRIYGTGTVLDTPGTLHIVSASGPSGTGTAKVIICVGEPAHVCDTRAPYGPYTQAFVWTKPNVPMTPDTNLFLPLGGRVTDFTISPALPAGLTLNPVNGIISGTPTTVMAAKEFIVSVIGPFGIDSQHVSIAVLDNAFPVRLLEKGVARFQGSCTGCHNSDGKGSPGATPPLFKSDYLMKDKSRLIRIQLLGIPNEADTATTIVVNGESFTSQMSAQMANDSDIAAVLTFERTLLNGATDFISPSLVGHIRDSLLTRCAQIGPNCGWGIDTTH